MYKVEPIFRLIVESRWLKSVFKDALFFSIFGDKETKMVKYNLKTP